MKNPEVSYEINKVDDPNARPYYEITCVITKYFLNGQKKINKRELKPIYIDDSVENFYNTRLKYHSFDKDEMWKIMLKDEMERVKYLTESSAELTLSPFEKAMLIFGIKDHSIFDPRIPEIIKYLDDQKEKLDMLFIVTDSTVVAKHLPGLITNIKIPVLVDNIDAFLRVIKPVY